MSQHPTTVATTGTSAWRALPYASETLTLGKGKIECPVTMFEGCCKIVIECGSPGTIVKGVDGSMANGSNSPAKYADSCITMPVPTEVGR